MYMLGKYSWATSPAFADFFFFLAYKYNLKLEAGLKFEILLLQLLSELGLQGSTIMPSWMIFLRWFGNFFSPFTSWKYIIILYWNLTELLD